MSASNAPKPNVVTLHGRDFKLCEPDFGIVLRLLNVIGDVGVRADAKTRAILTQMAAPGSPDMTALLFGVLAAMQPEDVLRLGAAVLQFPTEGEGVAWLQEHGVKIAPLVRAFVINISLSTDLVEAIENFTQGITGMLLPLLPSAAGLPEVSP